MKSAYLFIFSCSLVLTGCSLHPTFQFQPEATAHLAQQSEITDTPFIQQDDYQCGPASLAMILNYHGYEVSAEQLAPWVFTPNAKGSFPAEMDAVARQQGFISYPIHSLTQLITELNAQHPVLVLQNMGLSWYPVWHFAVVVGYNLENETFILRSGDQPRRQLTFRVFDYTWKAGDRWARVVLPAGQLPITAEALPYLKAAADLQQTGPKAASLDAFQAAVQHWPDHPTARFGLANQYMAMKDYELAFKEYKLLLEQQPEQASTWNNLAYNLLALQCHKQAITAVKCARQLSPDDSNIKDSEREIRAAPVIANSKGKCQTVPDCPTN